MAHHTTKHQIRTQIDGKNITRSTISRMQHRSFFVSHGVVGVRFGEKYMFAYQMYRLTGDAAEMANTIRTPMCRAKIAMLEELLNYHDSLVYLGYSGADLDYSTSIRAPSPPSPNTPTSNPPFRGIAQMIIALRRTKALRNMHGVQSHEDKDIDTDYRIAKLLFILLLLKINEDLRA